MTDRTDHRAAAERMLADADEWAARQAASLGMTVAELAERFDLETGDPDIRTAAQSLSAAIRYAANEARQREAEPDPLALDEAECSRCGTTYPSTAEATMEHHRACTGETPENPMGDPLDEDDHRDRLDAGGTRWTRAADECWSNGAHHVLELISLPGPLTFAPDADGAPSVTAPVDDDPVDDAVDGEEGERRNLNAQTGLGATYPDPLHLTILRDTVSAWRNMSAPSVSTRGWQRGWRAGVDLCTAILAEIADEYEREMRGGRRG